MKLAADILTDNGFQGPFHADEHCRGTVCDAADKPALMALPVMHSERDQFALAHALAAMLNAQALQAAVRDAA